MAMLGSLLNDALNDLRTRIADAPTVAKYQTTNLLRRLAAGWNAALQDVNTALTKNPIYSHVDIVTNTTDTLYMVPAGVGGIVQIAVYNADGTRQYVVPCFGLNEIRGSNWTCKPPFIKFDTPWSTVTTLRVYFIPAAVNYMQTGATSTFTASTVKLNTTPVTGVFDNRPNAYLGGMIRVYATTGTTTGYVFWPTQERWITGYTVSTGTVTLEKAMDLVPTGISAQVSYEILPMVDPDLMDLAVMQAARHLLAVEQRLQRSSALHKEYQIALVAARRKYQILNSVREPGAPHKTEMLQVSRRPSASTFQGTVLTI